jgi:hypothetical protein
MRAARSRAEVLELLDEVPVVELHDGRRAQQLVAAPVGSVARRAHLLVLRGAGARIPVQRAGREGRLERRDVLGDRRDVTFAVQGHGHRAHAQARQVLGVLAAPAGLEALKLRLEVPLGQPRDGGSLDVRIAHAGRAVAGLARLEKLRAALHADGRGRGVAARRDEREDRKRAEKPKWTS